MSTPVYDILHSVSRSPVIDTGDLQAAARLILNAARDGLNVQRSSIWLLDHDHQYIRCTMMLEETGEAQQQPTLSREQHPAYFTALDQERAIIVNHTDHDANTREILENYLKPLDIQSLLDAPIRHYGKMIGVLSCEHRHSVREWRNEEIAFLSTLADLYGRAVTSEQRLNYERQLELINEQLESKVLERTQWLENALRNLTHTQAKLIESEKLASIGRMVSGLAHEINTPLGIAVTSASHCESELKKTHRLYNQRELDESQFRDFLLSLTEGMHLVSHNLNRATNLVQNFRLSGAIQTSSEEEEFELHNCLEIILKSLQPLLKDHHLAYHFSSPEPIRLNSYPGAIAQILTNLVTNSINHGFIAKAPGDITINIAIQNEQVHLHYRDNGSGINEEIHDKIFEPFFTTARKTGGSGLGLSIVHNLVTQKLKGSISVEQTPNEGAGFLIRFPLNVATPA
jgi:two-component system NtrC family sensor kinase